MNLKEYVTDPENRKTVIGVLAGVCVFFLLVLLARSCRRPDAESVSEYLQNLSAAAPEKRTDAVLGLARLEVTRAAPQVEALLEGDPDQRVRRSAAYALLVLNRSRFLEFIGHADAATRLLAIETIARREKESAFDYMQQGLRDPDAEIREVSFNLMDRFGGRRALRVFQRLAEDPATPGDLRLKSLGMLGRRGGPEILDPLRDISRIDPVKDIRDAAAAALREAEQRLRQE